MIYVKKDNPLNFIRHLARKLLPLGRGGCHETYQVFYCRNLLFYQIRISLFVELVKRFSVYSTCEDDISLPMYSKPIFLQANAVVPLPINGSYTSHPF